MDAIKFAFSFLLVFVPFAIAKFAYGLDLWWLCWITTLLLFIFWELWGVFISKRKKTISRQFWEFKDQHPVLAGFCVAGWLSFAIYLAAHLWFRV